MLPSKKARSRPHWSTWRTSPIASAAPSISTRTRIPVRAIAKPPPCSSGITASRSWFPRGYKDPRFQRALHRASSKPRENVTPLFGEIVPPGIADQAGPRGPTAAAQHLALAAKPRFGIFFIRIRDETGVRQEVRRRPFPDIADHLPAPERAVARRQSADRDGLVASRIQMR